MWDSIFENIMIMVLTIVFLLGGGYVLLVLLGWGLKFKSKDREKTGLADMWVESQAHAVSGKPIDNSQDAKD